MALLVAILTGGCSQNPKSADSGQADGQVAVIDPSSRTGPSWTVVRDIQLKHGSEMEGFLNEDIGIAGEEDILMQSDSAIADISFTDEKNGTIVFISLVTGAGHKPWCLVTSDGGSTWIAKPITMPEGFQPSALFLQRMPNI